MNQSIDIVFVPEKCDPECPILRASQIAALSIVAEAQSLFQGFLKCLDKMEPGFHIGPDSKKGSSMLEHFTCKLDQAMVNLYNDESENCSVTQCGNCLLKDQKTAWETAAIELSEDLPEVEQDDVVEKEMYDNVVVYNQQLQEQCASLETRVNDLLEELAKRRSQYNNRLLIQIFEDQYRYNIDEDCDGSFFDVVPRERLGDFIPFIRNIVLGPAVANQFDEQVELILEHYKDGHGHVPVGRWDDVLNDPKICKLLDKVSGLFYERSQHRESFRALIHRKAPVSPQKYLELITLFESMGVQHEFDMVG